MPIKVVSTMNLHGQARENVAQMIEGAGGLFVPAPEHLKPNEMSEFIHSEIADAEVMLGWQITKQDLEKAKNLKWMHVPFAGVNRLLDFCPELKTSGITITNGSGTMSEPMADTIMGYILVFNRLFLEHFRNQKKHVWGRFEMFSTTELSEQTLGIVGYGNIGKDVARRAKAFGMRIIATKSNPAGDYPELDEVLPSTALHTLLEQSDYVLIATPLTPETRGMIGKNELDRMKSSAIIMNVGRGPIIKQDELVTALQEKRIGGAALDVTDPEPLPADSPLWDMENVIITPHASPISTRVPRRMIEVFVNNLKSYLANQPMKNVVDLERGY